MNNIHRFTPRRKAPPPRRPLLWARAAWLPWALVLAGAVVVMLTGVGNIGAFVVALAVVIVGAWLEQQA